MCDVTERPVILSGLSHKKVRLVTVQPLFARSKKRKPSIMQKSHQINCDNYRKPKRHSRRKIRPLPQNAGSGRGGAVVIKSPRSHPCSVPSSHILLPSLHLPQHLQTPNPSSKLSTRRIWRRWMGRKKGRSRAHQSEQR